MADYQQKMEQLDFDKMGINGKGRLPVVQQKAG